MYTCYGHNCYFWDFEYWPLLCYVAEKAMAPHSSTLAWKIPWMEEPGRLQSMGLRRVGHGWATSLSLSCIGEGNGNPLQCSCLENPRDGGAWWAAIYGVAQSRTRLKRLSSNVMLNSFNKRTKAGGGSVLKYQVKVLKYSTNIRGRIQSMDR